MAIVRMNHRIAAVEAWLSERPSSGREQLPADLMLDIAARFHYWHGDQRAYFVGRMLIRPTDPVGLRFAKGLVWLAITAFAGALWSGTWATVVLGVIGLALLIVAGMLDRGRRAIVASTAERSCSECGYDLSGCDTPIPPAALESFWIGPRLCPECGAAWPMLPPRAPADRPRGAASVLPRTHPDLAPEDRADVARGAARAAGEPLEGGPQHTASAPQGARGAARR